MTSLLTRTPSHWNLNQSVYSSAILIAEYKVEESLHIRQTKQERSESYSFLKGIAAIFVKIPFCVVSAVVSLIEGVARFILSGGAYVGSLFHESWNDVPGNLFNSAIAMDRPGDSKTCLQVFLTSFALPFSDISVMIPKILGAS